MGLMSGIAITFGKSEIKGNAKAQIKEEIDFFAAISAHVSWKVRLQNYLEGRSSEEMDPDVVCCDDKCELGKWIHGPGLKHFFSDAAFHELRADHARFHVIAANVVRFTQVNDGTAARSLLDGEYRKISHKLVHSLTELNKQVSEE